MRTSTALATLLAAGAIAQPHIHARHAHEKHHRDLEKRMKTSTDWVTEWVTKTVTLDAGEEIPQPTSTSESSAEASPGNFKDHTRSHTKEETTESSVEEVAEPTSTSIEVVEEPEPTTTVVAEEPKVETPTTAAPPPAETTTEVEEPEPTTTAGTGGGGSSGSDTYSDGEITYYATGQGACGYTDNNPGDGSSPDNPMVVALSAAIWFANPPGGNPNKVEWCNRKIAIHAPGKSVTAYGIIRDSCQGCSKQGDIDVNLSGMQTLYPDATDKGRQPISWSFI